MQTFDVNKHQWRECEVLHRLRTESRKDNLAVVRFVQHGTYVLVERHGSMFRELHLFNRWPDVTLAEYNNLLARMNPVRDYEAERQRDRLRRVSAAKEGIRDTGRAVRRAMRQIRSRAPGVQGEHPSLNWPAVKGEGI